MSSNFSNCKIAFIGGGNMASAIIGGLLDSGLPKSNLTVSAPSEATRQSHANRGANVTSNNVEAARDANVVVLAVKPYIAKSVCEELGAAWSTFSQTPIIVSVAAGLTVGSMRSWLRDSGATGSTPVVRVMPNTASLVGEGAAGVFAEDDVTEDQRKLVNDILNTICKTIEWVDKEELINVVTAVSGKNILLLQNFPW